MSSYDELRVTHADAIARASTAIGGVGKNFADDPSVQLASTVDYLTAERDEWKRRALAAEAQLAAVPVGALQQSLVGFGAAGHDAEAIEAWIRTLSAQPQVQP